jgi:uncharacterized cupredoxin-like copper-binding protein
VTDARARRLSGPVARALPWAIAAVLLLSIGLPSAAAIGHLPTATEVGYARPASGNSTAAVNLTDRPRFDPNSITANASSTLSVHLTNTGQYVHTFTVSTVPNAVLNGSWTPTELDAFFNANGSLANVSVAPGSSAWANLTFNSTVGGDSFEFVSVVPYQFQAGMWGFVNVSSTGPGVLLSENTTDSYQFVPSVLSASPTHYPVVLNVLVTNQGALGHTYTVSPLSNFTLSPANFTDTFAVNAPLVSAPVPGGAGSTVWANFTIKAPGVYQYICTVTGHFANGMTGFLYVGVPVPPPPPVPSTAIVDTWILVGTGVLLGIGVLLAVVASYLGRFPSSRSSHEGHH